MLFLRREDRPEQIAADVIGRRLRVGDRSAQRWVRSKLEAYCQMHAATVVLASHNMAEVERLAGRVIMLEKGRIIADETPRELIERFGRTNLEEVFLAIARRGADDTELRP